MLGLAYECEPTLDRLAAHYGEALELRHAMVVLVHDVADFMTMEECALFHNADVLGFIADAKNAKAELIFDATNPKGLEYTRYRTATTTRSMPSGHLPGIHANMQKSPASDTYHAFLYHKATE